MKEKVQAIRERDWMITNRNQAIADKNLAIGRRDKALEDKLEAETIKDNVLERVRETEKERDEVIRRFECFICSEYKNAFHAFIPCGHMICLACKDDYGTDAPCPKCRGKIMGRLPLFN